MFFVVWHASETWDLPTLQQYFTPILLQFADQLLGARKTPFRILFETGHGEGFVDPLPSRTAGCCEQPFADARSWLNAARAV